MGNDLDRDVRRVEEQDDWSGGMNLVDSPNKLASNQARIIRNWDTRNKRLEKAKGQKPDSRLEIGGFYYDRFNADVLDVDKWAVIQNGSGASLVVDSGHFKFQGATSNNAWNSDGLLSVLANQTEDLSYVEFELTTPSAESSITRFRIQLAETNTILESENSLTIEFDENKDIIRRENGAETDTGFNWVVDTTYRVRIEKQDEGWKASISAIPVLTSSVPTIPTSTTLFTTSFEGHLTNYIHYQVYGGLWLLEDVVSHEGFAEGVRKAANGLFRFYRETEENQTIIFANNKMYRRELMGDTTLLDGLDINATWQAFVHLDKLICCNGVNATKTYDGSSVVNLGTGATQAPIAKYGIVHLQTPFLAGDPDFPNSLYRASVKDPTVWDKLEPLVDVDAWEGDIITGFVKIGPSLFIVKSSSVWELVGAQSARFSLRRVLGAQGCLSPYSIASNGVAAFWRGLNGLYRFNGINTTLISYLINPLFEPTERSLYPTTVFQKSEESVGVIHNNKYRCAVVQHGEGSIDSNNFEYVYDFIGSGGAGSLQQRSNRNVSMYSVWIGQGDNGELFYVPSDSSNTVFRAEIDSGNVRHDYLEVALHNLYDTNFVGRVLSRHIETALQGRKHLDKHWNHQSVHYEPIGNIDIGVKFFTARNPKGDLFVVTMEKKLDPKNLTDGIPLADPDAPDVEPYPLLAGDYEEKERDTLSAGDDANMGVSVWYEITQDQEVRTKSNFTATGQRLGLGNFEAARIRRVVISYAEGNL